MTKGVKHRLILLVAMVALLLTVQTINSMLHGALNTWGIYPRHLVGLRGIICAPWLHVDWAHLLSNLPPLCALSALLMLRSIRTFVHASVFIMLAGGFLVWLLGRPALHVGASGWIFGLWALLLAQALFQRRLSDWIISVLMVFYYGGMWYGLVPREGVSLESHLGGVVAGILYAWLSKQLERRKKSV